MFEVSTKHFSIILILCWFFFRPINPSPTTYIISRYLVLIICWTLLDRHTIIKVFVGSIIRTPPVSYTPFTTHRIFFRECFANKKMIDNNLIYLTIYPKLYNTLIQLDNIGILNKYVLIFDISVWEMSHPLCGVTVVRRTRGTILN